MTAEPTVPRLLPIDRLSQLDEAGFAAALRPLFEAAPPLAARLRRAGPFPSYEALLERAAEIVGDLPEDERVAVVNAHPRIGASPAVVRQSSALSYREQGYEAEAGLDPEAVAAVYRELAKLNRRYEERFGFRFVVFVNRRPKSEIVDVLRARIDRARGVELATALAEMLRIAEDRLRSLEYTLPQQRPRQDEAGDA
jgi:OHCU decarboxylase